MSWIKEVLLDLTVSLFIAVAVLTGATWMYWVITGYTAVMLAAKIIVLVGDNALNLIKKTQTGAPDWFSHLLYGVNIALLLWGNWWYTAAGWLAIWALSYVAERKLKARQGKI